MTQLAQAYHLSRTFLYHLLSTATLHLEKLFSDDRHPVQHDPYELERLILLLRLEGQCSIPSLSAIVKELASQPNSVGYLSESFQRYGRSLPSTLSMPSTKMVFYLSDAIVALRAPILVTIEAQSTAILNIERAADRSAQTWQAHFDTRKDHRVHSIGMASDRGLGLVAGYQAACKDALWVCDVLHAFQALFHRRRPLERTASAAIGKEDEATEKFHPAQSEANLHKRLHHYEQAHQACEQAMARYDQLDLLLHLLRDALHFCSPFGRLRTVADVRAELTRLLRMSEEIDDAMLPQLLKPLQSHLDDILVPLKQVESMHAQLLGLMPPQT
jgi:hypothetical protein